MNLIVTSVPLAIALASPAFGQAGAEGQYDLLYPAGAAPAAAAPAAAPARASAMPAAPVIAASAAPLSIGAAPAAPRLTLSNAKTNGKGTIGDYDFGEVVQTLRNSVQPLAGEMTQGFPRFVSQIDDAIALMDQGRNTEAVALSAQAIDGVIASRDQVVNPLWEAQFYLNEQIAMVRSRLADAMSTNDPASKAGKATEQTAQALDGIAKRISETKDPVRKRRLIAHYRTMRTLSTVRASTLNMTPDQRKLWFGVLKVLEQASLAHQQVLMGSEALFAQLDGTGSQLRDYLGLIQTMEGVDQLLGSVQGGGMAGFVEGMRTLQEQMEGFTESMQGALEASMTDLESRVDELQTVESEDGSVMAPTSMDDELMSRINRVAPVGAGKE